MAIKYVNKQDVVGFKISDLDRETSYPKEVIESMGLIFKYKFEPDIIVFVLPGEENIEYSFIETETGHYEYFTKQERENDKKKEE